MPRYEWNFPITQEKLQQVLPTHPAFSNPVVPVTDTTITLSADKHADRNVLLKNAAGVTVTLPKATGSGDTFKITVGTLATANNHIIKVGSTADAMVGTLAITDTDTAGTVSAWATASTSDTITLNRSTTGSVTKGEYVVAQDTDNNTWSISGMLSCTGTAVTPFSSTVN